MSRRSKTAERPYMAVTTPREVIATPAVPTITTNGPTTAYRDAPDGKVERKNCLDGRIPNGWFDTPAKCSNCDGMSHPEYVEG